MQFSSCTYSSLTCAMTHVYLITTMTPYHQEWSLELLSSHYTGTSTFEEEERSEDAAIKGSLKTPGEQDNMWTEDSDDDSTGARHIGDEGAWLGFRHRIIIR